MSQDLLRLEKRQNRIYEKEKRKYHDNEWHVLFLFLSFSLTNLYKFWKTSKWNLLLWIIYSLPAGVWPVMELSPISWPHLDLVRWPEPAVDVLREELWLVAAVKVAFPARGPEVGHCTVHEALDPVVLLLGLEADQVHAALPAVVPRVEPVPLGVAHPGAGVLPREPVVTPLELVNTAHLSSWG